MSMSLPDARWDLWIWGQAPRRSSRDERETGLIAPRKLLLICIAVSMALSGCRTLTRLTGVEEQLAQGRALAFIEGRVETSQPADGTLVVLLVRPATSPGEDAIGVDTFVRVRPGEFGFLVSPGRYQLGAYLDRNQNKLLDVDEPVLDLGKHLVLEVAAGEEVRQDLVIPIDARIPGLAASFDVFGYIRSPEEQQAYSLWALSAQGAVCEDLDDDSFGPDAAQSGLWEMADFVANGNAGVYFLEPYDPKRIPVLFVHGIIGYPQQFSTLFDSIDRERFQPWFYFYPSGYDLEGLSSHLATLLERLQVKHGFDRMAIVAHSMGGLVSRGAIFRYQEETEREDLELFVSIATPWGGDTNAGLADTAPVTMPLSFKDMNPESEYLRWAFYEGEKHETQRHLPEHLAYHMIVGFRMRGLGSVADDGTVTLASQARLQVQQEAQTIRAFDYGHVDILHSPEVVWRLGRLLESHFSD
jgi:pimeloyl-ACP methyl ester carboxylesterase